MKKISLDQTEKNDRLLSAALGTDLEGMVSASDRMESVDEIIRDLGG